MDYKAIADLQYERQQWEWYAKGVEEQVADYNGVIEKSRNAGKEIKKSWTDRLKFWR